MTKPSDPDIWFPFYVGAYQRKTTNLSTIEHGAYLLLMLHYYVNGRLADDDKELAIIARLSPHKWKKMAQKLRQFFEQKDGRLFHERIEREMADSRLGGPEKSNVLKPVLPPDGMAKSLRCSETTMRQACRKHPARMLQQCTVTITVRIYQQQRNLDIGPRAAANDDLRKEDRAIQAIIQAFDDARAAVWGESMRRPCSWAGDRLTAAEWLQIGATPDIVKNAAQVDFEGLAGRKTELPKQLKFIDSVVRTAVAEAKKPPRDPLRLQWRTRADGYIKRGIWLDQWGGRLGDPGCKMPHDLQQECVDRKTG
jgi:uncharacterized protein YdaU (DUF1376 family)